MVARHGRCDSAFDQGRNLEDLDLARRRKRQAGKNSGQRFAGRCLQSPCEARLLFLQFATLQSSYAPWFLHFPLACALLLHPLTLHFVAPPCRLHVEVQGSRTIPDQHVCIHASLESIHAHAHACMKAARGVQMKVLRDGWHRDDNRWEDRNRVLSRAREAEGLLTCE